MNIINVAWSFFGVNTIGMTSKTFLGLQGYYSIESSSGNVNEASGKYVSWLTCPEYCGSQCNTAGEVAFALTLTAAILSVIVAVFTISRFFDNTPFSKFMTVSGAFFANAVSVTAFCNWHLQCYLAFQDNFFRMSLTP